MTTNATTRPSAAPFTPDTPGASTGEPPLSAGEQRIAELLAAFGDARLTWRVEWYDDAEREWAYCGSVPLDYDTPERVMARWGGGRYKGRVVDGANAYKGYISELRIAGPHKGPGDGSDTRPAAPQLPALDALAQHVRTLTEQVQALALRAAAPAVPPVEPFDLLEKVAGIVRNLGGGGGLSVETLKLIEDARRDGMELGKQLAGDKGEDDGFGSLVESVGKPLVDLATRQAAREPAPRPALPAPAAPRNNPPSPTMQTTTSAPAVPAWAAKVRPYIGLLRASAKRDPETTAEMILDNLQPADYAALRDAASADDFEAATLAALPELATDDARAWSVPLLRAVRAALGVVTAHETPASVSRAGKKGAAKKGAR